MRVAEGGVEKDHTEIAMPSRFEPPLSRLDVLLAHPFLMAIQENLEAPPVAHPDAAVPQAAYPQRLSAGSRLRLACRALRRNFAAIRYASEPAQSEDEFGTVLMFSLTGLALSLYLAAPIHMSGADNGLAGILMLLS